MKIYESSARCPHCSATVVVSVESFTTRPIELIPDGPEGHKYHDVRIGFIYCSNTNCSTLFKLIPTLGEERTGEFLASCLADADRKQKQTLWDKTLSHHRP